MREEPNLIASHAAMKIPVTQRGDTSSEPGLFVALKVKLCSDAAAPLEVLVPWHNAMPNISGPHAHLHNKPGSERT